MAESIFYYLQTVFCYTFFPHRCYFYMASDFMLHTILHLERLVCHIYSIVCLLLSLSFSLSHMHTTLFTYRSLLPTSIGLWVDFASFFFFFPTKSCLIIYIFAPNVIESLLWQKELRRKLKNKQCQHK